MHNREEELVTCVVYTLNSRITHSYYKGSLVQVGRSWIVNEECDISCHVEG